MKYQAGFLVRLSLEQSLPSLQTPLPLHHQRSLSPTRHTKLTSCKTLLLIRSAAVLLCKGSSIRQEEMNSLRLIVNPCIARLMESLFTLCPSPLPKRSRFNIWEEEEKKKKKYKKKKKKKKKKKERDQNKFLTSMPFQLIHNPRHSYNYLHNYPANGWQVLFNQPMISLCHPSHYISQTPAGRQAGRQASTQPSNTPGGTVGTAHAHCWLLYHACCTSHIIRFA